MKTNRYLLLLSVLTPGILLSQQGKHNPLVNPQIMKQQAPITITNHNQIPSHQTVTPGKFKLSSQMVKAVVATGHSVTKIKRGDFALLEDTATRTGIFMLPELYYGKEAGTNNQVSYRILFVDSAPLRFDFGRNEFEGGIRFLAVEENYSEGVSPAQKELSVPEEIIVSFGTESIPLDITSINWPPKDVTIISQDPLDSIEVKIITISKPQGYSKYLRVEPAIVLSSKRETIQGFGLQTMPVSVALKGVSSCKPISLTVQSTLGSIKGNNLTLSDNNPSEATLRSEKYGNINLSIFNPTYRSNSISVSAIFPWLFLILAVVGGLIGSIAKKLKSSEKVTFRAIIFGCIIGFIVAVAYYGLGINLLNISFEDRGYNEAVVFGIGLLTGFIDVK